MSLENVSIQRDLILGEDVSQSSIKNITKSIYDINYDDDSKCKELSNFVREPIKLYLNTYGGSVYDGLSLINTIEHSKAPIYTICSGSAMSMGLPILLSGSNRYAYKYSTILYHEITTYVWDKIEQVKQDLKETERLQVIIDNIVLEKTNILKEKLDDIKERKIDWFIPADEALKLGIIDEIL